METVNKDCLRNEKNMSQTSLDHYIECSGGLTSWFRLTHGLVWIWIVRNPLILDLLSQGWFLWAASKCQKPTATHLCFGTIGKCYRLNEKEKRGKNTTFEQLKSTPSIASIGRCLWWFHASARVLRDTPLCVYPSGRVRSCAFNPSSVRCECDTVWPVLQVVLLVRHE